MIVLALGPENPLIRAAIEAEGDCVVAVDSPLHSGDPLLDTADCLVSFGYRHLIPAEVLAPFGVRAMNLHVSMLPWNRGADPNLWSFLEQTPKGVSIHVLDPGLDTGPLLLQRAVRMEDADTLRTSYERLKSEIEDLFIQHWSELRAATIAPRPQDGLGTVHRVADKERFADLLTQGWDTPVSGLIGAALERGGASGATAVADHPARSHELSSGNE